MTRLRGAILSGLLAVLALTACGPLNPASPPQPPDPRNRTFYIDLTAGYSTAINGSADPGKVVGLGTRNAHVLIGRLDIYDPMAPGKQINHPRNGYPPLPLLNERIATYGPNRFGIDFNMGGERGWRYPFEVAPDPGHSYVVYVHASTLALHAGDDIGCKIWEFGGGVIDENVTDYPGPDAMHKTISVTCVGRIVT